jgi:hypothetical protein
MRDIRRARKMLQQAALKEFPNPDRIGCPAPDVLEAIARRQRPTTEVDLHHITHCSPCFATFLAIRHEVSKQRLTRAAISLAGLAVLVIGVYWGIHFRTGYQATAPIAEWNLEQASPLRGTEDDGHVIVEAPSRRGTVLIQLPLGSDDGQYDVEIRRNISDTIRIRRFQGMAAIQNGHTTLPIQMDFSDLAKGTYYIAFRHADASWHLVQLLIR